MGKGDERLILPLVLYLSSARLWNENKSSEFDDISIRGKRDMREITEYYDGSTILMMKPTSDIPVGILSRYANPEKRKLEEGAFERAMAEKHGKHCVLYN